MTRSTESKSVSIARYDFQNVRRESLLSQNRTASEEEDTNASSDTEEENMNVLLFDHKMIKISISIELNAWISTHEADDIIVFIKYICQQHDIEIKTHNDMIQMLKDVNETNITLKAAQTRLQKDVRIMFKASHRNTGKRRVNQVNENSKLKSEIYLDAKTICTEERVSARLDRV